MITGQIAKNDIFINFIDGKWLELYTDYLLHKYISQFKIDTEVKRSVKIKLQNGTDHEIDIVFRLGNDLYLIECNTGDYQKDIGKLNKLQKLIKLPKTNFLLLSTVLYKDNAVELTKAHHFTSYNLDQFKEELPKIFSSYLNNINLQPEDQQISKENIPEKQDEQTQSIIGEDKDSESIAENNRDIENEVIHANYPDNDDSKTFEPEVSPYSEPKIVTKETNDDPLHLPQNHNITDLSNETETPCLVENDEELIEKQVLERVSKGLENLSQYWTNRSDFESFIYIYSELLLADETFTIGKLFEKIKNESQLSQNTFKTMLTLTSHSEIANIVKNQQNPYQSIIYPQMHQKWTIRQSIFTFLKSKLAESDSLLNHFDDFIPALKRLTGL